MSASTLNNLPDDTVRSCRGYLPGLLALSALVSPTSIASAQTRDESKQVTKPAATEFNSLTLPYAAPISSIPKTPSVAGIALVANSGAKELLDQFDRATTARDNTRPALVWNMMHGSPRQAWLYHG